MKADNWLTEEEGNFRQFMKSLNRYGGGIVFEALDNNEVDEFVEKCVAAAKVA